jgi:hypothetical protein
MIAVEAEATPPRGQRPVFTNSGTMIPHLICVENCIASLGVDLTDIPGINPLTAHRLSVRWERMSLAFGMRPHLHLGLDCVQRNMSAEARCCTPKHDRSRTESQTRLGAQCLYHANNHLGEFFRRMRRKLGAPEAVTATAHKLARIVYHVLRTNEGQRKCVSAPRS